MNADIDTSVRTAIKGLYNETEGATAFFDWAANRVNDAAETSVDRIAQVTNVARWQANELAKQLCEAGCGDYIVGRKGWKTRVRWGFSLRSLGKAARGDEVELAYVDPELAEDVSDQLGSAPGEINSSRSSLSIAEAKQLLAETLGVSADAIEITIRA